MFQFYRNISITIKLIVYFLIVSNISLFIVGRYSFQKASDALLSRTFDQLTSIRVEKNKRLLDFFNQRTADLKLLSYKRDVVELIHNVNSEAEFKGSIKEIQINSDLSSFLNGFQGGSKYISGIIFVDSAGTFYRFSNDMLKPDTSYSSVQSKIQDGNKLHEILKPDSTYKLIITDFILDKHEILGQVVLELSNNFIDEIMLDNNRYNGLGESGETYLVGPDFYLRSSSRFFPNSVMQTQVQSLAVKDALAKNTAVKIVEDYRGIRVLSSYSPLTVSGLDWVLLAEIDLQEAMIPINSLKYSIIYLSIIISLLLLGVVALLSSTLLNPLKRLRAEAENIYEGNYGQTVNFQYKNEIGDLITAFNRMSVRLKEQEEKLELEKIMRLTNLIEGQEMERSRLSKELHDGLGQQLLATKISFETLDTHNFESRKLQIKDDFAGLIMEIRNISNDLMPSVLINFGLKRALLELQRKITQTDKLKFHLSFNSDRETINRRADLYLYRIVQESVNNCLKHSSAKNFYVDITENQSLIVKISDDGCGFDNANVKSGNGLRNIRERVNILDGSLEIKSEIGRGSQLNIVLPL